MTDDCQLLADSPFSSALHNRSLSSTGCTQQVMDLYLREIASRCRVEVGKALGQ
jgi:hypothetical protein